jgi:hypothetical protein
MVIVLRKMRFSIFNFLLNDTRKVGRLVLSRTSYSFKANIGDTDYRVFVLTARV